MARTVRDITLALDAVVGPEPTDLRSLPMPDSSWTRSLAELHAPRKVGWSLTLGYAAVDARGACDLRGRAAHAGGPGHRGRRRRPGVRPMTPCIPWLTLAMAGNERALGHLRGTDDWARLDPGHVALIDSFGAKPTGVDVLAAFDACHTANVRLVELFHQVPLLLTPTVAGQVGRPGSPGHRRRARRPRRGWPSPTRST